MWKSFHDSPAYLVAPPQKAPGAAIPAPRPAEAGSNPAPTTAPAAEAPTAAPATEAPTAATWGRPMSTGASTFPTPKP